MEDGGGVDETEGVLLCVIDASPLFGMEDGGGVDETGGLLLWVVEPSPLVGFEDGGCVDETGVISVEECRARNASRFLSASSADDSDKSEVVDCPLSDSVKLGVVVMAEVAEVDVASGPSS